MMLAHATTEQLACCLIYSLTQNPLRTWRDCSSSSLLSPAVFLCVRMMMASTTPRLATLIGLMLLCSHTSWAARPVADGANSPTATASDEQALPLSRSLLDASAEEEDKVGWLSSTV